MELQLFIHKKIALHFYYSKESVKDNQINMKNIYIYFPGLPQIIDEDFFKDKVDKNTAFLSVHYLGSWLSGGDFTYLNCQKTIESAIEFVKKKKGLKTFDNKSIHWDYKNLNVFGYSFAGNPIVSAKISKNDVKNVFLFAPLFFLNKKDINKSMKNPKDINNFYGFNLFFLKFLQRGYKFAFRGIEKESWKKYFLGEDSKSIIKLNNNYPKITIFHGKDDDKIDYGSSLFFQKEKSPKTKVILVDKVGHSFRDLLDMKKINKLSI